MGGQIGAFYDLNGDGNLQCVGLHQISAGLLVLHSGEMILLLPELDGLPSGAVPKFAVLFDDQIIFVNEIPSFQVT